RAQRCADQDRREGCKAKNKPANDAGRRPRDECESADEKKDAEREEAPFLQAVLGQERCEGSYRHVERSNLIRKDPRVWRADCGEFIIGAADGRAGKLRPAAGTIYTFVRTPSPIMKR